MATNDPSVQLLKAVVAWGVILAVLVLLGVTITPTFAVAFGAALAGLAYVSAQSREISIPFVLSFIMALALVAEYILPGWFVDAFPIPDFAALLGFSLAEFDPLEFFAAGLMAIIAIWVLQIRLTGRAKKPTTITKRVRRNAEQLVDTYVTMTRLIAGFFIAAAFMAASQLGMLAGEFGAWFADVPFITGSVALSLGGWQSLGGSLPVLGTIPLIGTMNAGEFLVFALVVLAIAAAVKYNN